MINDFGFYPRFYVKKKNLLFPLLEQYSALDVKAMNHGQAIKLYFKLLNSNPAFKADVDKLIDANISGLMTMQKKQADGGGYKNALGATILAGLGSILGIASANAQAKANEDEAFYQLVLNEQKNSDTSKILMVSGVALAFVLLGVIVVINVKKSRS